MATHSRNAVASNRLGPWLEDKLQPARRRSEEIARVALHCSTVLPRSKSDIIFGREKRYHKSQLLQRKVFARTAEAAVAKRLEHALVFDKGRLAIPALWDER